MSRRTLIKGGIALGLASCGLLWGWSWSMSRRLAHSGAVAPLRASARPGAVSKPAPPPAPPSPLRIAMQSLKDARRRLEQRLETDESYQQDHAAAVTAAEDLARLSEQVRSFESGAAKIAPEDWQELSGGLVQSTTELSELVAGPSAGRDQVQEALGTVVGRCKACHDRVGKP